MKLQVLGLSTFNGHKSYEIEYNGKKYYVNLYRFQETERLPEEIDCEVKTYNDGRVSITQNIKPFLEERYKIGETYDFTVRNDFSRSGYYEVVDSDGFFFRLNTLSGLVLYNGQEVKCRVTEMYDISIKLELVSYSDSAKVTTDREIGSMANTQISADYLVSYIHKERFAEDDLKWNLSAFIQLIFLNEEPYPKVVNEYILNAIKLFKPSFDDEQIIAILKEMRDAVLFILEETDCLCQCDDNERKVLQNRLSIIGDVIKRYIKVVGYFSKGQVEEKVSRILKNLEVSGYVFQAEKQFGVMMLIFSLDEEMMENKMAKLFEIVQKKDVKYWKDEPFRTALIRLLELFISHKKEQIDMAIYDKENVKSILEALSMQLMLGNEDTDSEIFDFNLNRSMLYRYASYLKTSTPLMALNNAFLTLMDVNQSSLEYAWNDATSHDLLASKLSADACGSMDPSFAKVYKEGEVKLEMSDEGVMLKSLQVSEDSLKRILPADLLSWNHLQVKVQNMMSNLDTSKKKDLSVYQRLWADIERELFLKEDKVSERTRLKRHPVPGENYDIRVLYRDEENRLVCRIVEEDYEGEGYLYPKEIVPYNLNMFPSLFKNPNTGNSLLIDAKLVNIDSEDKCHFSIQSLVNETLKENINYTDRIPCIITASNENGYLGINTEGVSVRFNNPDEYPTLKCNDMVFATDWEFYGNCCYTASILTTEEVASHVFTLDQAFNRLMYKVSYDDYEEFADNSQSEVMQQESLLARTRVKELMNLIDRKASLENDYLVTYNYLGYSKLLARMINDAKRHDFYQGWMHLIAILHHFAINAVVPTKELSEFENSCVELFNKHSEIYRKYIQLKIVSFKGKPEKNNDLWEYSRYDDEDMKGLAECVLAFNLLGARKDSHTQQEIEQRIDDSLKIKDYSSKLHDFGYEDLHTEFKTSLVYPSNNNMQANLPKQTNEIMKEICAMLNAEGGHLYIGVNDCGVGVGMNNDLNIADFNGQKDKYDLYLRNQICQKFGRNVDAYVKAGFTDYSGKTVYEIEIIPYPLPVRLDGIIYERHGSSKVAMVDENEQFFIARRSEFFTRIKKSQSSEQIDNDKEAVSEKPIEEKTTIETSNSNKISLEPKVRMEDRIQVSQLRPVTPFSYDGNLSIIRYIQFMDRSYQMVTNYYAPQEDVLLTLAISEEDKDKYLVLAYEDGKICKMPISNILDKEDYKINARYDGAKLMFAEIAAEDDLLMTLANRKRAGECVRFDTISSLSIKTTMTSVGDMVCTAFDQYIQFDIVPASERSKFKEYTNLNSKQPGRTIAGNKQDKIYKALKKIGLEIM